MPKGSFYFYFSSKEEFGLELVNYFMSFIRERLDKHMKSASTEPLKSLRAFFREMHEIFRMNGCKSGCPIGNLTQEMADLSEAFRLKLDLCLSETKTQIAQSLATAQERNELNPSLDPAETADFILNSWEGAILRMKARHSMEPLILFEKMIFETLLRI